jgi:hypothetical protein
MPPGDLPTFTLAVGVQSDVPSASQVALFMIETLPDPEFVTYTEPVGASIAKASGAEPTVDVASAVQAVLTPALQVAPSITLTVPEPALAT